MTTTEKKKRIDYVKGMIEWVKKRNYLFLSNSDYYNCLSLWRAELKELEK